MNCIVPFWQDDGAIRDAGGSFGKKEKALEDQYFRRLVSNDEVHLAGLKLVSGPDPLPNRYARESVWSNSHSGLVSTYRSISWTGNWFRVAVTSLCSTRKLHLPYNQNKLPPTDTIVLTVQDQLAVGV